MFYIYFLPEKRSKDLQLNAAQQRISEMEAEILQLRKERDSAEERAEEQLAETNTALEEKLTELANENNELVCRFVPHFNPFLFTYFSPSI
jgi:triphosphoribosyl-dephospho-CoA synthetase